LFFIDLKRDFREDDSLAFTFESFDFRFSAQLDNALAGKRGFFESFGTDRW
jgi:hypothetical protein